MTTSTTQLPNPISRTNSGFTLIELMVTIAVLAIIVGIAAPNIGNQLANQRVKSVTATLENALKVAKSESVVRRQAMTLSYNDAAAYKVIEIKDPDLKVIASYNYDSKTTLKDDKSGSIIFEPSRRVNGAVTYTICDSNTSTKVRQVSVTKLGNISSKVGVSCT